MILKKELHIVTYQGFNLLLRKSMLYESYEIIIHDDLKYRVDLGNIPHGNMVRIENIVKNLEDRMTKLDMKNIKTN